MTQICKLGHERPDNKPRCRQCLSMAICRRIDVENKERREEIKAIAKKHKLLRAKKPQWNDTEPLPPQMERLPPLLKTEGYTREEWLRLHGKKK